MSVCRVCGGHTSTSRYNKASGSYEPICDDCDEKEHFAEVEKRGDETKRADDFKGGIMEILQICFGFISADTSSIQTSIA